MSGSCQGPGSPLRRRRYELRSALRYVIVVDTSGHEGRTHDRLTISGVVVAHVFLRQLVV